MSIKIQIYSNDKKLAINNISTLYQPKINKITNEIKNGTATWSKDWMGWRKLANNYNMDWITEINKKCSEWKKLNIKTIVVCGIGGSYLGVRAGIEMCKNNCNDVKIYWISNISSSYISNIINEIKDDKFGIVAISKSGTTLEPAIGLEVFLKLLIKNCKTNIEKYVVAITDSKKGLLLEKAKKNNWFTLPIPDDIGGRFSMLTSVGMFIYCYCGLNYKEIIKGAKKAYQETLSNDIKKNTAFLYASLRNYLHIEKKCIFENLGYYNPSLFYITESWKQFFCESSGKDGKGLFENTAIFTTDLHSIGQILQDGNKCFFETIIDIKNKNNDIKFKFNKDEYLYFLNGKTMEFVNSAAMHGTINAHYIDGKIDNILLTIEKLDEFNFGYLMVWLSMATTMDSYLLGVNPFNQPGVEDYKRRMMEIVKK